ncbi:hypothetical protein RFI_36080, partial [Reticulomyxa filosa]
MPNGQPALNILTGNTIENSVMTTAHNNIDININSNINSNGNEQVQMQISLNEKEIVDSTKNTNCVVATSHLQQYARVQEEKAKIEWKLQEIDVKHQHLAYEINRLSEVQRLFKINAS